MMIVPILAKAAVAAVSLSLAASSVRNMSQTYQVSRSEKLAPAFIAPASTAAEAVSQIQSMKRRELLELFFSCEAPSGVSDIAGEWNGCLLENNSWIMTSVTRFLTNRLFGRGRKWNGKAFGKKGVGVNRFHALDGDTERRHDFDYQIQSSRLGASNRSVTLRYSNYQFPLSLWYTMMDEIRCVPVAGGKAQVLIGLGCMLWSGGMLNASPFCLWRADEAIQ